jgi:hypothetical protein
MMVVGSEYSTYIRMRIHIKLVKYRKFKLLPSRYDRKDGNIARRYAIEGRVQ